MSSFLVSATHIDALLTGGLLLPPAADPLRWRTHGGNPRRPATLTRHTADAVGAMLLSANRRALDPDLLDTEPAALYRFTALPGMPDPLIVLSALACYEYQSCGTRTWTISPARAFCDALRHRAIAALPGYPAAPWHIDDRGVFLPAASLRPATTR
jgi:hypothetical protein